MGVLSCRLIRTGKSLEVAANRNRKYVHDWQVVTDDPSMGLISVLAGALTASPDPIPQHQSYYNIDGDSDMGSLLQTLSVKPGPDDDRNLYYYTIRCTWDAPAAGQGRDPLPESPLDWPVKWHAETSKFTRKATRDAVDERLLVNAAGDLFEDIEVDDGREIVTAIRNEWPLSSIFTRMRQFKNAVASDEFMGAEAKASKMDSITLGQLSVANDIEYYPVTYRIEFAEDGSIWPKRYDNRGTHAYNGPVKSRVRVLEGDRKGELLDWAYLNENGVQLADSDVPDQVIAWPPEEEEPYHLNPLRAFSALGLA